MAANERDDTGDWLLPVGGGPPTLYELEQRVEVALTVARAAETAALEIGAASVEAAQQARRAAELAQRASLAAELAQRASSAVDREAIPPAAEAPSVPPAGGQPSPPTAETPTPADGSNQLHAERLRRFVERADRLAGRLRALELSR